MKYWLLVSCGEPLGISYELILKTLKFVKEQKRFIPIYIGNQSWLKLLAYKYKIKIQPLVVNEQTVTQLESVTLPENAFLFIDVLPKKGKINYTDSFSGLIALHTLEKLTDIIKKFIELQKPVVVLTMPVSKCNIMKFNSKFLGHTEYFAEKFNVAKQNIAMLMEGIDKEQNLYRVLMLTRHIPLCSVSGNLNVKEIAKQVTDVVNFIDKYENVKIKKILFCNLNPHSGEQGYVGHEERTVLSKSVALIRRLTKKEVVFPIQASDAFYYAKRSKEVLIVTTYHDQAMIPLKLLCRYNIVNVTVGLPFIRVSPGHGTAFDIYLKDKADVSATKLCIQKLSEFVNNVSH